MTRLSVVATTALLATLLAPWPASAQRYVVEEIDVEALVREDGSLDVREVLTYDFDGRFSFAYRDIPRDADVRIEDVRVSENGVEYRQEDSEDPGTFAMTREGRSTRITWRYSANRERRTFTVSYRLRGEVKKYADTAELYYKFVGEQWDRPIGRVTATVR